MALFTGTSAANTIVGTASADTMRGYGGNDILDGRGGSDHIYGGAGDDRLTGGKGNDVLSGGGGKDLFLFAAGDGQDRITDLALGDVVAITGYGAAQSVKQVGSDVVVTLSASDKLTFSNVAVATVQAALQFGSSTSGGTGTGTSITGTSAADTLTGTSGNDTIQGLGGNDTINGGAGNDRIIGGVGGDTLSGGAGSDVFVYTSVQDSIVTYSGAISNVAGADELFDFDLSQDRVDLSAIDADATTPGNQAFTFGGSGVGHLVTSTFAGTDLVADTDGDGHWDLYIYFPGVGEQQGLTAANFIL